MYFLGTARLQSYALQAGSEKNFWLYVVFLNRLYTYVLFTILRFAQVIATMILQSEVVHSSRVLVDIDRLGLLRGA